jgi:hypothetical protein
MIKHSFLFSKNRWYHKLYQASVLQFRFESALGLACLIGSYSRQFPVSPRCEIAA